MKQCKDWNWQDQFNCSCLGVGGKKTLIGQWSFWSKEHHHRALQVLILKQLSEQGLSLQAEATSCALGDETRTPYNPCQENANVYINYKKGEDWKTDSCAFFIYMGFVNRFLG